MKQIPLTQGKFALVDDEDYEYLMQWKWTMLKGRHTFYAFRRIHIPNGKAKFVYMHRLLNNPENSKIFVDHKDGNGLNNQRSNLRNCTAAENGRNNNRVSTSKYGCKNVRWDKERGKWRAEYTHNKKSVFVGRFSSKEEAMKTIDAIMTTLHGEFVRLNFPA